MKIRALGRTFAALLTLGLATAPSAAAQPSPHAELMLPPQEVLTPRSGPAPAAPPHLPRRDQLVDYGIYRLDGLDANLPHTDLAPFRQILEGAQVVALGETYHTSGGYYAMKHRLFRYMVEEMGFRAFAMESPWHHAQRTADYVATCQGSVNDAMRGIFPVWASTETGALLEYMCSWNQTHPNDPITFFGFDTQQPEADGPALIKFLQEAGVADNDPRIAGIRRCDGVVTFLRPIAEADHRACLESLDAVDALLAELDPSAAVQRELADVEWAKIRAVGLRAWQGQSFYRTRHHPTSFSSRDRGMATAFQRIRQLLVGSQKTAIWAHNFHIGKSGVDLREWGYFPMGDLLDQEMGHRYASVALAAAQVSIEWPRLYCGELYIFPESAEALLQHLGEPYLLVDLDFRGTNATHPPYLDPEAPILIGYDAYLPREHYDALVYLENSPAMTPVFWPSCN